MTTQQTDNINDEHTLHQLFTRHQRGHQRRHRLPPATTIRLTAAVVTAAVAASIITRNPGIGIGTILATLVAVVVTEAICEVRRQDAEIRANTIEHKLRDLIDRYRARYSPDNTAHITELQHILRYLDTRHTTNWPTATRNLANELHNTTLDHISLCQLAIGGNTAHASLDAAHTIGIDHLTVIARHHPLATHHPAVTTHSRWDTHNRQWIRDIPHTDINRTYQNITRTVADDLHTLEHTLTADALELANRLAADDPDHQHTWDDLINTAAALAH
jgi:hypothetical protein